MLPIFNLCFDCCSLYLFFLSFPLLWWDALQWFVLVYSYSWGGATSPKHVDLIDLNL